MIKIKLLSDGAKVPTKAHKSDAGWDLYASGTSQPVYPHKRRLVSTDISIAIPDGYCGLIWPRSGLSVKKGIDVLAGVIDSGYRGEIKVCLLNTSDQMVHIHPGDRIAQLIIQKVEDIKFLEVDNLNDTDRGEGGFGSSGE
jgi:dUTP pyrophosphatase|tara:strand:+ start:627 stop:1049 length:423 start_codon:yes stop_codon:yes gene_type:complete